MDEGIVAMSSAPVGRFTKIPLHPFLLAIYPVIALYGQNVSDVAASDMIRPVVVVVCGTGVLLLVLWPFFKDLRAAATVASVIILAFFLLWGTVMRGFIESFADTVGVGVRYLFLLYALISSCFAWLAGKQTRSNLSVTKIANLVGLVLICLAVVQAAVNLTRHGYVYPTIDKAVAEQHSTPSLDSPFSGRQYPDIYFVVLDAYARADMLQQFYGVDNSPFLEALRTRGFFVADEASTSYTDTTLSLPACLNMDYIENLFKDTPVTRARLDAMCQESRAHQILKNHGYMLVGFDSEFRFSKPGRIFDREMAFPRPWWIPTEFELLLLNYTPLLRALRYAGLDFSHEMWRRHILFVLNNLHTPAKENPWQPVYVQAHIIAPHAPFVFRADGTPREPSGVFTLNPTLDPGESRELYIRYYAEQVLGLNRHVLDAVDNILSLTSRHAAIVLVSDHGGPKLENVYEPGRYFNLVAVRLPNSDSNPFPSDMNLVELFPRLFKELLGIELPLPTPPENSTYTTLIP